MKRVFVVGIVFLGCALLLGVALRKVLPPPPVNSFVFGPNEAYAKAHPTKVQAGPCAGIVLRKSDGTIEITVPAECSAKIGDKVIISAAH